MTATGSATTITIKQARLNVTPGVLPARHQSAGLTLGVPVPRDARRPADARAFFAGPWPRPAVAELRDGAESLVIRMPHSRDGEAKAALAA